MNDMTPIAARLNAEHARIVLEAAGAKRVCIVGRGLRLLAFFEYGKRREAWIIRHDGWIRNFERDVARELGAA